MEIIKEKEENLFKKCHGKLCGKIDWYSSWHQNPYHKHAHWGIFFTSVVIAAILLYSNLANNAQKVEANLFITTASAINLVVLDITVPDAWDGGNFTADIIQKSGTNIFWQNDILNNITPLGGTSGVGYKEDGTGGFQGTEAVVRDLDADSVYTSVADTAADCDGSTSINVGTCDSISAGATLVSMGNNTLDFDNDGVADDRPLCTDNLTTPTNIAKDNNSSCSNGAQGIAIKGVNGISLAATVINKWAFKDSDGDGLLDLGEDLYIQETAGKNTYSSGVDIDVYTTGGLGAGNALTSFAADCDGSGSGTKACKFSGTAPIDNSDSILIDEGTKGGAAQNGVADKQEDGLTGLGVRNIGTAVNSTDISAVKVWAENGAAGFQGDEILLGAMPVAGNTKEWRLAGLMQTILAGGRRIYVTADISATPTDGATLNFRVPAYSDVGDVGYFVSSNNQKPASDITSGDTFVVDSAAPATPLCSDSIDNDSDGVTDLIDPGCSSPTDDDESDGTTECQDGIDNDVDSLTDLADPGCLTNQDNDEFNEAPPAPPPPVPDTTPPALTSFTSTTINGSYGPGSTINITAHYNELLANGSLTVVLNNESQTQINLNSLDGQTISGQYVVGAAGSGEDSLDLTVISILNENVLDASLNAQIASTLPGGGNLGDTSDIVVDVTAPVISEIAAMSRETTDPTPNYLFIAYESGAITYVGSCASPEPTPQTVEANTETFVTFGPLTDNAYSNCIITVTDGAGNASNILNVPSFTIDATPPSGLANFSANEATLTTQDFSWTSASDIHFDHYEIWYGIIKVDVVNRTGTAIKWDNNDDGALANASAISTTITGLSSTTLYYYKIFAFDTFGNGIALLSINVATDTPPPSSPPPSSGGDGGSSGGGGGGGNSSGWSWSQSEAESEAGSESEIEIAPTLQKLASPPPNPIPEPLVIKDPTFDPAVLAAVKKIPNIKLFTTLNHGLSFGYISEEIKALQKFFNAIGITVAKTGPGSPGFETRKFGLNTLGAVKRFQIKYGVVKSPQQIGFGYIGPGTRAKIKEILKRF